MAKRVSKDHRPGRTRLGQPDAEGRALPDDALDRDRPVMSLDDVPHDVQAETLSLDVAVTHLRPTDKRLEDAVPILGQNAHAMVRDED